MKKKTKEKSLRTPGVKYSNDLGVFTLVDGKLYDNEGQRTSAIIVSKNSNSLVRAQRRSSQHGKN